MREVVDKVGGKLGNVLFWKLVKEVFKGGRNDYLRLMLLIRLSMMKIENWLLVSNMINIFFYWREEVND